ncbi:MAG: hypothetical protein JO099_25060 [Acidobacteriia bacterium]|nr:hypothetical protein [Terriglobia bacterium]
MAAQVWAQVWAHVAAHVWAQVAAHVWIQVWQLSAHVKQVGRAIDGSQPSRHVFPVGRAATTAASNGGGGQNGCWHVMHVWTHVGWSTLGQFSWQVRMAHVWAQVAQLGGAHV